MTTDTNTLLSLSRCYKCLGPGTIREAQLYLLLQWAKKKVIPSYPCGVPSDTIRLSGAGTVGANQDYAYFQPLNQWVGVTDPTYNIVIFGPGIYRVIHGGTLYSCNTNNGDIFPCFWLKGSLGANPPPTGQYV